MQQVLLMSAHPGNNGGGRDPQLLEGLLSNLPLFRQVAPRQVLQVAAHSRTQRIRRGAG